MHFVKAKGIIGTNNGMNIYRGCQHGCIYCDARSSCYQMNHLFEDIEVKENALELLESALKSRRKPTVIGTGAMTDPYMPLERNLRMTRGSLELIEKYGFGATVLTKSDLVLRDLECFKRIHEKTKAVLQISLTCMDDGLSRLIEPNVCPTSRRIEVLREFQKAGGLHGCRVFGIDCEGKPQFLPDKSYLTVVDRVSDTGDRAAVTCFLCDQAAQKVQFVGIRRGDQKIRVLDPYFLLHSMAAAVAYNTDDITAGSHFIDDLRVSVYDTDVMAFFTELLRKRRTDLAAADHYDFHICLPSVYRSCPQQPLIGLFATVFNLTVRSSPLSDCSRQFLI